MQISETGARAEAGFTLLELLVVVFIIAIVTTVAFLTVGGPSIQEQVDREVRTMDAFMQRQCERAWLLGRAHGVRILPDGAIGFEEIRGQWVADPALRHAFGQRVQPRLRMDGLTVDLSDLNERPQLICFPSGEMTPFELEIAHTDSETSGQLTGTLDASRSF